MGHKAVGKEKRKKGGHTAAEMKKAIDLHLHGLSIRKSAQECKLSYPTLRRYVLKYLADNSCSLEPNYEINTVFTKEQENELQEYAVDCAQKFYGLSSKDFRIVAYQMAQINNIKMPLSWSANKMAGKEWFQSFKQRHPQLSIKKPEACSLARATAFNKNNVQIFYNNLKEVLQRHPTFADGSRIYNLDETSTTTVQRPQKVLAQKGRSSCKITSGERGTLVTTCCIVNASGQALPPAIVFPRKNFQQHMLHGAPPGTLGLAASAGWMNAEIFTDVMKHFIKHSSASKDNPALLIIDNHESHLSIEALNLAKSSGVTILTLHPHTTAKMQPLDVGLHAPFKSFYNSAVDSWLMRNPGKKFTIYNVAESVGQAYLKSMTPINIVNAFKKCGIYPFDDNIFTDIDFMPSLVTDRPPQQPIDDETDLEEEEIVQKRADSPSILSINVPSVSEIISKENMKETTPSPSQIALNRTPSPSTLYSTSPQKTSIASEKNVKTNFEESTLSRPTSTMLPSSLFTEVIADNVGNIGNKLQSLISQNETYLEHNVTSDHKENLEPKTPCSASKDSEKYIQKPSTSNMPISFISPKIFMPAIKAGSRTGPTKRRLGRSIIATDTPEKNAIEERKQTKTKESKKRVNKVKQHLFKESKKRKNPVRKNSVISDDTDDDEFQASGSSSGGDGFISSEGEENNVLDDNFLSLSRDPREGEYVIIAFISKKSKVYYVAKILEKLDDENDCEFLVSYLKLKSKVQQKFIEPVDIETAGVSMQDIKYILPAPRFEGTSRRKTTEIPG